MGDFFRQQYQFNIDERGSDSQVSSCGTLISIAIVVALTAFTYYRISAVANRNGLQMAATMNEHYFTAEEEFGRDQGFAFAIALSQPLDPSIGDITIVADEWGVNPDTEKTFWRVS